ncbi:hypothetical protein M406DRAFT_354715, partial [Cryphonectria parasitica EP155]
MPSFTTGTPESMVKRTDSLNPETTCRGVTGNGRPCRRPLIAGSPKPKPKPKSKKTRLIVNDPSDPDQYCWQHKDQAAASASPSPGPQLSNQPILGGRTSIDSLTARLGLLQTHGKPSRPQKPNGNSSYNDGGQLQQTNTNGSYSRPSKKLKEWSFCCFRIPLYFEDPTPPPRPHPTPMQQFPN